MQMQRAMAAEAESAREAKAKVGRPTVCTINCFYYFAPGKGAQYCDEHVCMSVSLYVRPLSYIKNQMSKLHEIFCIC